MKVLTRIFRLFHPAPGAGPSPSTASFEVFAAVYTERARMWLILLGAGRFDAEDIVQNALLALWERRDRVPPAARPRWLQTAIHLRIAELRRSRSTESRYARRACWEAAIELDLLGARPEDQLAGKQVDAWVQRLVQELREERRAVVQSYFVEDQPMPEVAARLGLQEATAWSRWWDAKRDLRRMVRRARKRELARAGTASFGLLLALREVWAGCRRRFRLPALASVTLLAVTGHVVLGRPAEEGDAASLDAAAGLAAAGAVLGEAGELAAPGEDVAGGRDVSPGAGSGAGVSPPPAPLSSLDTALAGAAHRAVRSTPRQEITGAGRAAQGPHRGVPAGPAEADPARLRAALTLLVRAGEALYQQQDRGRARMLLDRYEQAYPERPHPGHHRKLVEALAAGGPAVSVTARRRAPRP